jgi:hypothetical protein
MGVDDLGSIMLEENVISSAGARHRSRLSELVQMIRTADRIPAQRDTLYRRLRVHWTSADDPTDERVVSHFSSIAMPVGGSGPASDSAGVGSTASDSAGASGPASDGGGRRALPLVDTR